MKVYNIVVCKGLSLFTILPLVNVTTSLQKRLNVENCNGIKKYYAMFWNREDFEF